MGRPRTPPLTDDQARVIQRGTPALLARHAGAANHRDLIRDFIALVFDATGGIHGPQRYEELLGAYGDGRRPSRTTISKALAEFRNTAHQALRDQGAEVEPVRAATRFPAPGADTSRPRPRAGVGDDLGAVAVRALEAQLARSRDQLQQVQRENLDLRTATVRAATHMATLEAERNAARAQADAIAAQLGELADALHKAEDNAAGSRTFALQSIELARAETRREKERVAELQAELKQLREALDVYRRRVNERGAA